jgi:hypothetical protein
MRPHVELDTNGFKIGWRGISWSSLQRKRGTEKHKNKDELSDQSSNGISCPSLPRSLGIRGREASIKGVDKKNRARM